MHLNDEGDPPSSSLYTKGIGITSFVLYTEVVKIEEEDPPSCISIHLWAVYCIVDIVYSHRGSLSNGHGIEKTRRGEWRRPIVMI